MTASSVAPRAAFQYGDFRLYQLARFVSVVGTQMQSVAVAWQVYAITHRPIDLGFVGLAQFIPAFGLSLAAGHVADRIDRKRIVVTCYFAIAACSLLLFALAQRGHATVAPIYVVLVLFGVARAFSAPAGQALMPSLVPLEHFANAVAWSSSIWQIATIAGPALGGVLYGWRGPTGVYLTTAILSTIAAVLLSFVRPRPGAREKRGASWSTFLAGIKYVWTERLLLGAVSLDLFAVLLGGAVALLPVYAGDILHVGPWGLGVLRSAPALGATVSAVAMAYHPLKRRAGTIMLAAVAVYGLATIVFGVSTRFWLSLAALVVLGASDMVSVVVRSTLVQLNTPNEMRGRVSAVNMMFVVASNELGEFESGITASWFGSVAAVILGGVGSCLVVAYYAARFPELRKIDKLDARRAA